MTRLRGLATEVIARIGDHRHARLRCIGHRFARSEVRHQACTRASARVIVIGNHWTIPEGHPVDFKEFTHRTRILCRDDVGRGQHVKGAQSNVACGADGSCDKV